jgi:hypothetical protein
MPVENAILGSLKRRIVLPFRDPDVDGRLLWTTLGPQVTISSEEPLGLHQPFPSL